jgi:1,4-alpha-glucan branching enzyme
MPYTPLPPDTIDAVVTGQHGDPFAVLGPHAGREGMVSVRALIPAARAVAAVMPDGTVSPLRAVHPAGFWEGEVPGRRLPLAYRLRVVDDQGQVSEVEDPYRFPPTLSPYDLHLLGEGTHYRLFERLGAHPIRHEGVEGVRFVVWAPNARRVSVVGDWNGWDGRRQPMRLHPGNGLWELFVPGVTLGARYKYEIIGRDGGLLAL